MRGRHARGNGAGDSHSIGDFFGAFVPWPPFISASFERLRSLLVPRLLGGGPRGGERVRTSLGVKMKLFGRKDQVMSLEDRRGEREAAELKRLEMIKARKKGLLLPDAPELDIWMLWVMGPLIMYSCLVVPVVVAWDLETTLAQDVVEYIFDFTFFIDILINFLRSISCRSSHTTCGRVDTWARRSSHSSPSCSLCRGSARPSSSSPRAAGGCGQGKARAGSLCRRPSSASQLSSRVWAR